MSTSGRQSTLSNIWLPPEPALSTTLTTGDAAKESHLIFSRISFVPGQLNGPARKPKFQVSLREANYKLIWGQVDTMLWNHSPLKIKLFQLLLFTAGDNAAQRFPGGKKGGDRRGRGSGDLTFGLYSFWTGTAAL